MVRELSRKYGKQDKYRSCFHESYYEGRDYSMFHRWTLHNSVSHVQFDPPFPGFRVLLFNESGIRAHQTIRVHRIVLPGVARCFHSGFHFRGFWRWYFPVKGTGMAHARVFRCVSSCHGKEKSCKGFGQAGERFRAEL